MSLPSQRSLQLGIKEYEILCHIPPDRWVMAREISDKINYSTRVVSATISAKLLYQYVERREIPKGSGYGGWEYRRRPMVRGKVRE